MFLAGLPKMFFFFRQVDPAFELFQQMRSKGPSTLAKIRESSKISKKTDGINNPLMVCFLLGFPHYVL